MIRNSIENGQRVPVGPVRIGPGAWDWAKRIPRDVYLSNMNRYSGRTILAPDGISRVVKTQQPNTNGQVHRESVKPIQKGTALPDVAW